MNLTKRILCTVLSLTTALSFVGCTDDFQDENSESSHKDSNTASSQSWTVMLYLCGADLESEGAAASTNIEEILAASESGKINFLIETGGANQWYTEGIESDKLQRWIVKNGSLELCDEVDSANMGDPDTLTDFVKWGAENYEADKYMLTFWNHGGGAMSGACFDELYDSDSLSVSELTQGVANSEVNFEVVGFDTCLMSTIETAYALSPYSKYMVASEEYEPGGGWDYTGWLSYLNENADCDGKDLGTQICDTYYSKCEESSTDAMATLAVTDLTKVSALAEKFDTMAAEMTTLTEDISGLKGIIQGITKAENYGGNNDEEGYTDMVDLGDLIDNTENVGIQTAQDVRDAISDVVCYEVHGENRSQATGLSVFVPLGWTDEFSDIVTETVFSTNYLYFIQNYLGGAYTVPDEISEQSGTTSEPLNQDDYAYNFEAYIDDDGYYNLSIDDVDPVDSVQFTLFYCDPDTNSYIQLGTDDDIYADWDTGLFTDGFEGTWTTINGYYCPLNLISQEDGYNLYTIPIMLNGSATNLRIAYVWDEDGTGEYISLGAYDGIDSETGMSDRDIKEIKDGDEIGLLFSVYDSETNSTEYETFGEFTVDGELEFDISELIDGEYMYMFEIHDVFGNINYADPAYMTYENGNINATM